MTTRQFPFLRGACAAASLLILGGVAVFGCAAGSTGDLKGVEARIATKIDNSRKIDAENVETFVSQEADKWMVRMLVAIGGVCACAYPVGKIIWIIGERAKDAAKFKTRLTKARLAGGT